MRGHGFEISDPPKHPGSGSFGGAGKWSSRLDCKRLHYKSITSLGSSEKLIDAFAKGAILQVVLVAALFGLALIHLGERASFVKDLVDQLTRVVFAIVEMIIALSPVGAFGAMAFTVGRFGLHSLLPLLKLILVFYGACLAFVLIVLVPIARHVGFSLANSAATSSMRS